MKRYSEDTELFKYQMIFFVDEIDLIFQWLFFGFDGIFTNDYKSIKRIEIQ